ncbi:MAG: prepilin-type N-terminal cleavage/methylation domain-containing protein [Candidatus Coatesbacteria bacterium]|nr:prepilin-type N-terminal cleavage/methylation domain-containing protein [Candidatus Coatesbacteria bacterium]
MKNKNKGFTLVELMAVCVLFVVGILALGQARIISIKADTKSTRMGEATMVSRRIVERTIAQGYNYLPTSNNTYNFTESGFNVTRVVTVNWNGQRNVKHVLFTLVWKVENMPADTLRVTTLISRRL